MEKIGEDLVLQNPTVIQNLFQKKSKGAIYIYTDDKEMYNKLQKCTDSANFALANGQKFHMELGIREGLSNAGFIANIHPETVHNVNFTSITWKHVKYLYCGLCN